MRRLLGACLAGVAILGVSCGSDDDDSADPSEPTSVSSAPSSTDPANPIPPVRDPRDASALVSRPCDTFTADQLASKGFDLPPEVTEGSAVLSPGCVWSESAKNQRLSVAVNDVPAGLQNAYRARGGFEIFEIIDVGGNPAALRKPLADGRGCSVTILVNQTQLLDLGFDYLHVGLPDPCGPARELAQIAFDNLAPVG